ncbi:glycosyl hydrolase [Arenibacter sp. M-2]|uniref:Alpha-L-rhamnosidase n=1 Tax=Arenibacter algicola TaxID=616991 RepID=A0A221UYP7_9FLAO|nr:MULTISPECIES: glycosyl hydrolase [Arenibacter]ASO06485.1 alpha-L-rhamnosidase [Arenibacter algicola]MDL5512878.1 glycosyl hydrolase [Arenibacter sp. M-2]|tara:strand:- start:10252 stop:13257 length:3006 start_codon:yes stop_codon:yes gene_type:complete
MKQKPTSKSRIFNLFLTKGRLTYILIIAILFFGAVSCEQNNNNSIVDNTYNSLKKGFEQPNDSARAKVYWWWLNGHVDTLRMRTELQAIKEAGLSGVDIFDIGIRATGNPDNMIPAGPSFMGEESLKSLKFALNEAAKLNLDVGISLSSSWNAGGSWVKPEHAAKTIFYSKKLFTSNTKNNKSLPFPTITPDKSGEARNIEYAADGKPIYYEEVSVIAVPYGKQNLKDTTGIINVSQFFNSENQELNWEPKSGKWNVYRFICSNSGEQLKIPSENSGGPIIDHYDAAATQMHLQYFIDRLQPLVGGELSKSSLKYLYLASYEAKEYSWTSSFPNAFKELNGYDVHKFLPGLFDSKTFETSLQRRFDHDYAETFSELMIKNHYVKAKEICNQNGLMLCSESGGPGHMHHIPVETLKALGALDVPRGEFWYERPYLNKDSIDMVWLVKEIAAASNIYKKGWVEEEAFTSYKDWQESPASMKPYADRAFAEGMNRLVIHGFTHNPSEYGYPGIAYFAGTHYNDKRVWWSKVRPFNDYLARVSYILQNTKFVSDVLYYYGEEIPNLVMPKNTPFAIGKGYDYEVINTDILLKELTVENGKLVLPGVATYSVLYVSEEELSPRTLKKLEELAKMGAVIVGKKPKGIIGLRDESAMESFNTLVNDLWGDETGDKSNEKGKIDSKSTPLEALKLVGVSPDFDYSDNHTDQREAPLDYIHYKKKDIDFYFVRNTTDQWVTRNCSFRQLGKQPEIWDPVSGDINPITIFDQQEDRTELPLTLAPYGSYFVVFREGGTQGAYKRIPVLEEQLPRMQYTSEGPIFLDKGTIELEGVAQNINKVDNRPEVTILEGEWDVSFPKDWGAPKTTVFSNLDSWTESNEDGIRYFSGTATYNKIFDFKKSVTKGKIYLDLGQVAEVGEVWLNARPLGITWTQPHSFDVSDIIMDGENTITIEVANTWSNRLTGDGITGEKFTQTNIVKANKNVVPWGELPLKTSGLIGPVTLKIYSTY